MILNGKGDITGVVVYMGSHVPFFLNNLEKKNLVFF